MINHNYNNLIFTKPINDSRWGRPGRRCRARLEWLEDRTLLSGIAGDTLASVAIPIALGAPTTGTLAAGNTVFYQVAPTTGGKLVAQVSAAGAALRLSLLDGQGQALMQSDGQSPAKPDALISVDVSAGPEYLEVENLGAASAYTVTASLTPASTPFQTVPLGTNAVTAPYAVVAGDFNGDGRIDLAVADHASNQVSVLMGNGDGSFGPQMTYDVGAGPFAVVAADFTGNGRLDLAVANSGDNDVSVLLNKGDGTFESQATYTVGSQPQALVAGDFRGDGRIDLAIANSGENTVSVLPGNGDGTFATQVTYTVGSGPTGLAAGDFRGDGRTDLAVANSGSNTVSVLLSNGDGTFAPQVTYNVGSFPYALVAADFRGDGRTDLAVANQNDDDVSVLLGNGDGTFGPQATYAVGHFPFALVAGDFQGNGRIDLAVASSGTGDVSVLLGKGDGTFAPQATYTAGLAPITLVAGDFRGDGRTDLAVGNALSNDVSVLLGNGDGTFAPQVTYAVGPGPQAVVAGDFNNDGRTDLAIADSGGDDVTVLVSNGDGTFRPPATYAVGSRPVALVAGDFTGDGRLGLAVANSGSDNVSVLLGNGDGTFAPQVTYAVGSFPSALVAGDFTGDGRTDLAVADRGSNDVSVLFGNGDGTFGPRVTYAVGSQPSALVTGRFTAAGPIDLAVANAGSASVSVLLGNGDGSFQPQVQYAVGSTPVAIVVGDFRGNGMTDLAVANSEDNDVSVLLGNGDGTFAPQVTYAVGSLPVAIVAGDFTGDGRTDLATVNYLNYLVGNGDVSVLLGNGDGSFQPQVTYAVGSLPTALVAGDVSGDGRTDLAVVNYGSCDVSVLLGNGDGTFHSQVTEAVGSTPELVVAADFNGDGRTDLAVANFGSNTVSILLGNGDGTFQPQVTYAVGSQPEALVAGDFNGDGRIDLAVANEGSNNVSVLLGNGDGTFHDQTTYPVGTKPSNVVAADFNGDGHTDLAVANYGSNDVSVLLGNGDGTFDKAVSYKVGSQPASIVAADFNGDGRTDLAVTNSADDTVSVLLGNGDGTFRPQVTYPVGTEPEGLIAGDLNGDGRIDLADANMGSGDVSVLLGNGDGTFQPQVRYMAGNGPSGLAAGNFTGDGRTDLAVANAFDITVSVLPGNGDGTFGSATPYNVGSGPSDVVAGDFNGDGQTGLATVNAGSNNVSVLLNLGGTLMAPGPFVTAAQSVPVVADLTGDGVNDVFVVDAAGDILWRQGRPLAPGTYDPPITINPGRPSRDIVTVGTNQGLVLASVDATDNAISLYAWRAGSFALIGSLATGRLPAQIAVADLTGSHTGDLVVRNAGDGTLSVFFNTRSGSGPYSALLAPFLPPETLTVGPSVSDITLADVSGSGRADLLLTYRATGEVGVVRNLGGGVFAPVVMYPAGTGLYAVTSGDGSPGLTTFEATAGITAGALAVGGPADLLAIDPGSNTFSVLAGLGGDRFANPVTFTTPSPAIAVQAADLEGRGIPDTIVLSSSGVTVYRGDGKGGFLPDPFTIAAGPEPIGMTVGDVNGDGKPDLLVSNAYGDLLVLLGNGDGTFAPYHQSGQNVALAVLPNGSSNPDFIFADQGRDRVVVNYAGGQSQTLADSSSGLLAPGAVKLADLNGDGIPDLIVANSGSNNVLVYPGLANGQFGPELNGGTGFFTGTTPVGITVANLNGRPDLVIANEGSNDVSILFNVPTPAGGFTFVPGPRLAAGLGPTATIVEKLTGNSYPDLLISDGGSNQLRLLRGVGGGFFADQDPTIYSVGMGPILPIAGDFVAGAGMEIGSVNQDSNTITLISDFTSSTPVFATFSTGGREPAAAFGVTFPGETFESLVVANAGDGVFALLGGAGGLAVERTQTQTFLPEPTALDFDSVAGDEVRFYAATAGTEAAFALEFTLPETALLSAGAAGTPVPASSSFSAGLSAVAEAPVQLVALNETSLSLVVTVLNNPAPSLTLPASTGSAPAVNTAFLAPPPSQGQSLFTQLQISASGNDETVETAPATPVGQAPTAPLWVRSILGSDEAFREIRQENRDGLLDDAAPSAAGESARGHAEDPSGLGLPGIPAPPASAPAPAPARGRGRGPSPILNLSMPEGLLDVERNEHRVVDQAIAELGPAGFSRDPGAMRPATAVAIPVLIAFSMVVRTNRPGKLHSRVREAHR
jgi:hypothetical protein